MKRLLVIFLGYFLLSTVGISSAQSIDDACTQNGSNACIDWDRGVVIAEGIGAPNLEINNPAVRNAGARRAARMDAARNLLEMIKGVNLSSRTTVRNAIADDRIRAHIQGYIKGLRAIGEPRYFSDGSVIVRMEARLFKTIPEELIFQVKSSDFKNPPTTQTTSPPVEITPEKNKTVISPSKSKQQNLDLANQIDINQVYTGLIIDARKTDVQPALSPKIFDEHGKEIYGSAYVDREYVLKYGMAGYVKSFEQARENDRVKGKPLEIKALKSIGKNSTDLVVSEKDANALRQIASTQSFLREARVVLVLD